MARKIPKICPVAASRVRAAVAIWVMFAFAAGAPGKDGAVSGEPDWLSEVTTLPAGDAVEVVPCRLDFVVSWSKVVVAGLFQVTIGAGEDERYPGKLIGTSEGGSRGAARALWPYDHHFTSAMDPKTLRPVAFHAVEVDRKETLWTTNRYGREGVTVKSVTLDKKDEERKERTREYPFPQAQDLMSAFLYARSLSLGAGDEVVVLVQPFGGTYMVRFTMLGQEKHRIGLGEFDAMKVDIEVLKVEKDLSLTKYEKVKKVTAWVSNDEYRMPLEVRADIFVGSIRVILKEREFLGKDGKPLVVREGGN